MNTQGHKLPDGIAVIGMAGRYPGADNLNEFWQILTQGRETITHYTEEELIAAGYDPDMVRDPSFVKSRPVYRQPMRFDASFFGYTPREAEIICPQQRVFLECCWEAMEDSGYDPLKFEGPIGLYGGSGMTAYGFALYDNDRVMQTMGGLAVATSNEKDYFATRVGYKLNLRGPCVTVQTACSTALVGISFACQSLLAHQTDMAIGGGATIVTKEPGGYLYTEGGIVSPDGHNRTFDARAKGTIFGSGAGAVVLKRLEDALRDGDNIHAVIRGYGINNDGSSKAGFTAPAVDGQAAACLEALAMADINPETLNYIECHGTATALGDVVEITALTKAFRAHTDGRQFCAVGSVKTNIGHMDSAAGIAGFTKAVLALKHRQLPPSLHFETPNPAIDFANSPFFVNTKLTALESSGTPLRAGISSFGVGGTNTHVLIEEAPPLPRTSASRPQQVLVWSAKTATALERMTANLADHLQAHPELPLADVAFTLQNGRRTFAQRAMTVVDSREQAIAALRGEDSLPVYRVAKDHDAKEVVFLFPGQGAQHVGMAAELYRNEQTFAQELDRCCESLTPHLGLDLRTLLYPAPDDRTAAEEHLKQTQFAQPALFVIEYALAKLWLSWGVKPAAMVGHSIGEYAAACLAGVLSVEDALRLVAERGRLMQAMPPGAMLGVLVPEDEMKTLAVDFPTISIAAVNAPGTTVVSGPIEAITKLEALLEGRSLPARRLFTSHAFHSAMMDPMLADFRRAVATVKLSAPTRPFLSNLTGTWITAEQAQDPEYWVQHLRNPVRFSDNVAALLGDAGKVLLEVGPGRVLGSLASQHPARKPEHVILASLPDPKSEQSDLSWVMTTVGRLWLEGKAVSWKAYRGDEVRRRVSLPTYPFDHEEYFVENPKRAKDDSVVSPNKIHDMNKWFHYPTWKRAAPLPAAALADTGCALLFLDELGLGARMGQRLEAAGWDVIRVTAGKGYASDGPISFSIRPGEKDDYEALLQQIAKYGLAPSLVMHFWSVTDPNAPVAPELECFEHYLDRGFISMMNLAPGLNSTFSGGRIRVLVVGNQMHDVTGNDVPIPTKAAITGPCRSALAECPNIDINAIDVDAPRSERQFAATIEHLLAEAFAEHADEVIAYRGDHRWLQGFESLKLDAPVEEKFGLRDGGVYLVTGGLGGIGIVIAEAIATRVKAKIALFGRSALPPREMWAEVSQGSDLSAEKIRRIQRMEALGSEVVVFSANVSDLDQMRAAVTRIEKDIGTISGIFHAAGTAGGGIMQLKTRQQIDQVLLPKIKGTLVLEEVVRGKPLDFFMLCSSLNAFLGEGGISDYIAGNAFIDAFAFSRKHQPTPPISIQWDSWEEVGMVAKGWHDGVKIDWENRIVEPLEHPFFEARITQDKSLVYTMQLDPAEDWVIGQHLLMGTPTLVGTTTLEWARSAFLHAHGADSDVELRDVLFLAPLVLSDGNTCKVEVALERQRDAFGFAVRSRKAGDSEWLVHTVGKVMVATGPRASRHDLAEILARCGAVEPQLDIRYPIDGTAKVPFLSFSDRWINMSSKAFGHNEALGEFKLGEDFRHDFDAYAMHPAMLDRATGFAVFKAGAPGGHYLPFAYNRIRVSGALTPHFYSHVRYEPGDEFVSNNVTLFDAEGTELIHIEGYEVKRVPQDLLDASSAERVAARPAKVIEPEKLRKQRILSTEGMEVFHRLLGARNLPQIAVACRDLRAVQAEIRGVLGLSSGAGGTADKQQHLHSRPALATAYIEPRNELEQALADIWGSMLGIDKVGIHDDFLELGGNSLLGIQIASRIRADFEVELSVATFYKAPTVAALAEAILETMQAGLSAEELAEALKEVENAEA